MVEEVTIGQATELDVRHIISVLLANRHDPSIFLRSEGDVRQNRRDFIVAKDRLGQVVGCAAVHAYSPTLGEILSVAVVPEFQGQGIGGRLVEECLRRARANGIEHLWLATVKPGYFARFGFKPISRWKLPVSVLLYKLRQVFQQPWERWLPALSGRFQFMEQEPEQVRHGRLSG